MGRIVFRGPSVRSNAGVVMVLLLCSLTVGCGSGKGETAPVAGEWDIVDPVAVGLDQDLVTAMFVDLRTSRLQIDGVVVIRSGAIVAEGYRNPFEATDLHALHSCTKSVVSACIGIAIADGLIGGVDTPVADLFPARTLRSSRVGVPGPPLTLSHLLTMTTGLDSRDSYLYRWSGLQQMGESEDWLQYALDLDAVAVPGSRFDYSNIASFLLSAAIQEAAGMTTAEFARDRVFGPLGIGDFRWDTTDSGYTPGWSGLFLSPRDLARFGELYLNSGEWNGRQVVPAEWVQESWIPRVTANTLREEYGYQWWMDRTGSFLAIGYGGQYLIINPEHELVVVMVSSLEEQRFFEPYRLYATYILPAARAAMPKPAAAPSSGLPVRSR